MNTLTMLVLILIFSRIFEEIAERTGNPALLGDILAGFIFGPVLFNVIQTNETLEFLGFIGVVFIMLLAGIKVNLKKVRKVTYSATLIAIFAAIVPLSLGIGVALFFKMNVIEAAIIGVSLSITASAIVAEILEELRAISTKVGETLIVAGVFDDIIGLITITVLLISTEKGMINDNIFRFFINILLFFITSALVGYYTFPKLIEYSQKMESPESKFSIAIILVLLFGAYAEILGMSAIIGAFLVGLALNHYMSKKDKYGFEKDIKSLSEGFMAPIFFVLLGASMNISIIYNKLPFMIAIILVAFIGKIGGGMIGGYISGHNLKDNLAIGSGMATRGAITLVVAHIARKIAYGNPGFVPNIDLIYSSIIAAVFFVNLMSIPLLRHTLKSMPVRAKRLSEDHMPYHPGGIQKHVPRHFPNIQRDIKTDINNLKTYITNKTTA